MKVDVNGTQLWFDVDGPGLEAEGVEMRTRPTVVLLHGGPGGFDHSYFKPDFSRLAQIAQVTQWPHDGFIDKAGEVSIRLDEAGREEFMEKYDSQISVQYGAQMKEFVVIPDDLLRRHDELREWFVRSREWVGTKQPK